MISTHSFIDKSNTIVKGNRANLGLNPIIELQYGNIVSRALLHFSTDKLKERVADKTYPEVSKLKHTLRMFNPAQINPEFINCGLPDRYLTQERQRATSFDLVLVKCNKEWDGGRGFDYAQENNPMDKRAYSQFGSSWYNAETGKLWDTEGVYSTDYIADQIDSYKQHNPDTIVVSMQHFDFGNEVLSMDVTDYVNGIIDGSIENHGLMLMFTPDIEEIKDVEFTQYVGFFTVHTNTFFQPYVESVYDDYINDDRTDFYPAKDNRLYFYANAGGNAINLDELPTATINNTLMPVKQATKGVYYIEIPATVETFEDDTMYYDVWNFSYKGKQQTKELYFTPKNSDGYFSFGLPYETEKNPKFKPTLYGIKQNEVIRQGDIRKINVDCKIEYTADQLYAVDNLEFRVYVLMGEKEIDVYPWAKVDRMYNSNSLLIDTNEMLPSKYFVDIKATYDDEQIITKNALTFTIASDGGELKC